MKKVLFSIFGLVVLAGCSTHYDYYKGGVKYTQDGADCVYTAGEQSRKFSDEVRGSNKDKKIVYRNTLCADLYAKDTFGQVKPTERKVLTTAAEYAPCSACTQQARPCSASADCGCNAAPVLKRRYVIVSAM